MRVRVERSRYLFAHGKAPRGFGLWWFLVGGQHFRKSGSFSEVLREAKALASRTGQKSVEVLP